MLYKWSCNNRRLHMLKKWAKKKCLNGVMGIMGIKEGQWVEIDGKEFMVSNGELYERKPVTDIVPAGIMINDADANSPLRHAFYPQHGAVYYYWTLQTKTKEWELQCAIYHETERDKQNACMHNCFAKAIDAVAYMREIKKLFE